ncbi:MAG: hypothetical protein SFY69_02605 [Planctomycetota bacterium]|nr:hypothetical protein [Planctomycetota bacterium]
MRDARRANPFSDSLTARRAARAAAWACVVCGTALAQPVFTPLSVAGSDDTAAVGAAALGGFVAAGDTFADRVEIMDFRGTVLRTITRAELLALMPWMALDGGPDGPGAVAVSASGKQVFVLVHDDTLPGDGLGSDGIVRYDLASGALSLFARADLFDRGDQVSRLAAAHHAGLLFVGSHAGGGQVRVYVAGSGALTGSLLATWTLPVGGAIRGIAIDRVTGTIFAANANGIFRAPIPANFGTPPAWTLLAGAPDIRGLAWGETYGGSGARGLYILTGDASGGSRIDRIGATAAYSATPVSPQAYASGPGELWHSIAPLGDGRLVVGLSEDAAFVSDAGDPWLTFDAWMRDELAEQVRFARGLISPDGEPAGWVIDADTTPGAARFHPATPDGAAWTVLLLLAGDAVLDDPNAQGDIRTVLSRYAGLSGVGPSRTSDGIFRHWIDPATGGVKSGWDPEFATMSTMKIVAAAARAAAYYPDDPQIVLAAQRIIFRVRNWDSYIQSGSYAMFLKGQSGGGAVGGSALGAYHEGLLFVDQAGVYGGPPSVTARGAWLDRSRWPVGVHLAGFPITGNAWGGFQSAFTSVYPALLMADYRANAAWRTQVANIRWSSAAWTDDNAPRLMTVFSAGTTRADWGGYNADSFAHHPGDVTTLTALAGLAALGDATPAAQAYHAYRAGARQTFRTGATILYRRSDVDPSYNPNSAGLPDVAMGGLALAGLIEPGFTGPGFVERVLATPYSTIEMCPVDRTGDGAVTIDDLYAQQALPTDLNADGVVDARDAAALANWLRRREGAELTGR